MLSAADLAFMQATASSVQTTPCQVLRKTSTSDGMGGVIDVWASIASTTCRVAPDKRMREDVEQGRIEASSRWLVYLPAGQDVTPADRISALGVTYEVTGVGPQTLEIARVVTCTRIQ